MKYSLKGKESVTLCKKKKVYKKPVIKKKTKTNKSQEIDFFRIKTKIIIDPTF